MRQGLPEEQRRDAVSTMVYEANVRMRDPVFGCVGAISCLQQQIDVLQTELALAQAEIVSIRISSSSTQPQSSSHSEGEVGMMKRLEAKEEEIAKIGKLNWALEERVKSLCVENQIWRDLVRTNEATANALRTNLEQVLAQFKDERLFSDDDGATVIPAGADLRDDAQSCCGSTSGVDVDDVRDDGGNEGKDMEAGWRRLGWGAKDKKEEEEEEGKTRRKGGLKSRMCRLCEREESCVLMLPCRHLCLCTVCGSYLNTCPVCRSFKTGSVHVNMS